MSSPSIFNSSDFVDVSSSSDSFDSFSSSDTDEFTFSSATAPMVSSMMFVASYVFVMINSYYLSM